VRGVADSTGGIGVAAGVDTAIPAFRIASGQHECLSGLGVVVDHPQANNNGGAMLFVTATNSGERVCRRPGA
jgi:hypothetical protein